MPHYAQFRSMARMLAFEADTQAQENDWAGAINSRLDCIRFGQDISHGTALIGMLVSRAVKAIGLACRHRPRDRSSNAPQARAVTQRMAAIVDRHVPVAAILEEEKWTGATQMLEIFRDPKWRGSLTDMLHQNSDSEPANEEDGNSGRIQKIRQALRWYFVNKNQAFSGYLHYMDQTIANARQPYALHLPDPPKANDPVNEIFDIDFAPMLKSDAEAQTRDVLLLLHLALRAYRVEHGHYPDKLTELVPSYLPRLPADPMALQGTFGYQRIKTNYLLTSAGGVQLDKRRRQTQPAH